MTSSLNIALASSTPPKLLLDINTSNETILWRHCISCQLEIPCQQFELTISTTEVTPSDFQTLADALQGAIFREKVFSVFSLIRAQVVVCGQVRRSENNQSPSNHLGVSAPLPFWGLSNLNGSARPCFAISLGGTGGTGGSMGEVGGMRKKFSGLSRIFTDRMVFL